mmetsp:Transcript_508/g.985  ORF Transcript_508/g.985 Transcript_508/m.985 type:complete len:86 (+) Transcript_508:1202-1459(+)
MDKIFVIATLIKVILIIVPLLIFLICQKYKESLPSIWMMLLGFGVPTLLIGFILFSGVEVQIMEILFPSKPTGAIPDGTDLEAQH